MKSNLSLTVNKRIAVLNFKGGVGKTTVTISLGAALARMGNKVLVVDLDGQCNTTQILGYRPADGPTLYEAMTDRQLRTPLPVYGYEGDERLDFVPASPAFERLDRDLAERYHREDILLSLLHPVEGLYDFILMDCPPSTGVITTNAMCAATDLLVPLDGEMMSLQGVSGLLARYESVRSEANPSLELMGFVFNRYNAQANLHKEVSARLRTDYPSRVFDTTIRRCIALAEAPAARQTIYDYDPASNACHDFNALAQEVLCRCGAGETTAEDGEALPHRTDAGE